MMTDEGPQAQRGEPSPVIIEAALNGGTPRRLAPRVPRERDEIVADAIACFDAGATIMHNHLDDPVLAGSRVHDPQPYLDTWRAILAQRPDALLYPTLGGGAPGVRIEERYAHIVALARAGVIAQGVVDTGSTNIGRLGADGLPRPDEVVYLNTNRDGAYMVETCRALGIGLSISIFEPGFLRFILAYHRAGRLPPGSFVKFYFGGEGALFGLPPTRAALLAYLDMIEGTGLPWLVSVQGGDVVACGLARTALELGGHLQVGLEPNPDPSRGNLELVCEAVALCAALGRPVADPATTARLLRLPPRASPG
jgi:3-keto-5-aminohexanoate cleavage enzyme